ncbi:MAG TPA: c-type cytochrome [Sphingobium sp.]|nr:c-type cytochrome [Sphingobium sp.]
MRPILKAALPLGAALFLPTFSAIVYGATPGRVGDARAGATAYDASCGGCHSLDANRVGPAHRAVVGRKAGTVPGYTYSPALKKAKIVWTAATLDAWLSDPQKMVPGTRMAFRLTDAKRRADIIAFLAAQQPATASR